MKKLSEALPPMLNTAQALVSLTKTLSDGQETLAGKTIIQSAKPLIDHSKGIDQVEVQARSIKSFLLAKKPKKQYEGKFSEENGRVTRHYHIVLPDVTDDEKELLRESRRACSKEIIINLITRYLSIHKRMMAEGEEKQVILYKDMADILYGLPEYALTLAVTDILKDPKQVFFPVVGQIKDAAEQHIITWPEKMKGND